MYLVDTNVWLEVLLAQQQASEAKAFFERIDASQLSITEFSLYSLGIILTRLNKDNAFIDFLSDVMEETQVACIRLDPADLKQALAFHRQFQLDFDDPTSTRRRRNTTLSSSVSTKVSTEPGAGEKRRRRSSAVQAE
ncbi:MAG: PIN domain-containing protein [Chloroflexota bacterium]